MYSLSNTAHNAGLADYLTV